MAVAVAALGQAKTISSIIIAAWPLHYLYPHLASPPIHLHRDAASTHLHIVARHSAASPPRLDVARLPLLYPLVHDLAPTLARRRHNRPSSSFDSFPPLSFLILGPCLAATICAPPVQSRFLSFLARLYKPP